MWEYLRYILTVTLQDISLKEFSTPFNQKALSLKSGSKLRDYNSLVAVVKIIPVLTYSLSVSLFYYIDTSLAMPLLAVHLSHS